MIKVVAKGVKGKEFFYSAHSAHRAPVKRIREVVEILNENKYQLKDGETWHIYEVGEYEDAFYYADHQRFGFRGEFLVERKADFLAW